MAKRGQLRNFSQFGSAHLFMRATLMRARHHMLHYANKHTRCISTIIALQATVGDEAFAGAWAEGRAMVPEEALALVSETAEPAL